MEDKCLEKQQQITEIELELTKLALSDCYISKTARVFHNFYLLLKARNKNINLVADSSFQEFLYRHVIDSIYANGAMKLENNEILVDIGSGAGFPGLPLSITNPGIRLVSIESTAKKAKFQSEVINLLSLKSAQVLNARVEDYARTAARENCDIVVSRAVASLATMAELSLPLLKIGGIAVFYKSSGIDKEIEAAQTALSVCGGHIRSIYAYQVRESDPARNLIIIEKNQSTPDKYPRRTGLPFKSPL
jgi:16S rRNA (guanine527-N7)-methyltransferase